MASPPPFDICGDLDDDPANPTPPAPPLAAPTPNGLNDRLLRLTRTHQRGSAQNPNPNPNPPPPPPQSQEPEPAKVKLAGRRRLCKLSTAADESAGDDDSIRDILDDLTTRLDSLSVDRPAARPRPHVFPLPCALDTDPSPSQSQLKPRNAYGGVKEEVTRKVFNASSSSFWGRGNDDKMKAKGAYAFDTMSRKSTTVSKASKFFGDYDDEDDIDQDAENGKENHVIDDNDAEDVGWEKTEDFKMEPTGTGVTRKPYKLPGRIFNMLYPHQREGLRWLWVLHCRGTGGILGDDMGLGKTMQVSAFLAGLFHSRLIKRVLVVAPKTLLTHWTKELSVVGLKDKIRDYSCPNANARNYELKYAFKEGGILLTTYDIVRNNFKLIKGNFSTDADDEEETLWNYVILDEGHIIKNPKTQRAQSLFEIPCVHRVVISGTPIQNNLKEMWALFYFCCPEVLGDKEEFKARYEQAIIQGNDKNATNRQKHIGSNVAKELRERIKPYFLRRMKNEVFLDSVTGEDKKLAKKNELIIWLKLSSCQRQLYEAFLNSELVHSSMQGSPLAAITILKKICDHPLLLTKKAAEGVLEGMDAMLNNQEMGMVEKMAMNLADMAHDDDDDELQVGQDVSCKLSFMMSLLRNLVNEGHNVLIFSQTRKMLNIIQEAIILEGYKFLRIDGTTKISERERIVKDFQEGPGAPIFLLTTQVGGLGLTLTKAARVIVVDPAWNPSTDNQSVDRAYRIGQMKDVIVYRLMTSGTIEEKIYKLQVFKGALFRTATEHKEQTRYFSKRDIQELFSLPEQGFDISLTQKQLQEEHGQQIVMDDSLRKHIQFLEQQGIAGVSHHSLLFSKTAILPTLNENDALDSNNPRAMPMAKHYYKGASSDYVANGAAYAMKPKEFTARTYSPNSTSTESPEEIKAKINRLSQTLANTVLVAKLPDRGDKIRRQINELDEKLTVIESSPEPLERKCPTEVICLDDLPRRRRPADSIPMAPTSQPHSHPPPQPQREEDDDHEEELLNMVVEAGIGVGTTMEMKIPRRVLGLLYPHQRDALAWLWALHCTATGGILADDMGLGKTIQVSALLAGLFHSNLIKRALIVAPKTDLTHWVNHLSLVGLQHHIRLYSGPSVNDRTYQLNYTFKEGGILLTSYHIVRNNYMLLRGNGNCNNVDNNEEPLWDYVILDEGHIVKNPKTQSAQSLFQIPSSHRIIVTGTPIQNKLKEMWALFYFCCPDVLGDEDAFEHRYEKPILSGNDKNATDQEKQMASNAAKELRERIKPHFLRRMKSEIFVDTGAKDDKRPPQKNELRRLYEAFLNKDPVHSQTGALKSSSLEASTILRKICDHPLLLTKRGTDDFLEEMGAVLNNRDMCMVERILEDNLYADKRLQIVQGTSCKIAFILPLLRNLVEEGHYVLIFSQTRVMLNLIQDALSIESHKFLRIDGTTKLSERKKILKDFQEGLDSPILLLTSHVGGLGNTLTKADRVIVVDPAWNPSTDNQSVDRAYRIGQTKDVIVYRLVTCGTIEEKIYKQQIFKGGLFRTATEFKEQPQFYNQELYLQNEQEYSSLPPHGFDASLTQHKMQVENGQQLVTDESLKKHIQFLEQQGIAGVNHHGVLFRKTETTVTLGDDGAIDRKVRDIMVRRCYAPWEHICRDVEKKSLIGQVKEMSKKMDGLGDAMGRIATLEEEYAAELIGMLHENRWERSHLEKIRVQIDDLHEEHMVEFDEMLERIKRMELADEGELIAKFGEMVETMRQRLSLPLLSSTLVA
uniref:Protein CHROMATIN REMODELING 24 n=1 Tax=Oryza punctata TaxID=4537 RepID=A0A0E0KXA0_ORYPU